jgi:selenide,water dikinase
MIFDPQTSGGLLICVDQAKAQDLVKSLKKAGYKESAVIGEVTSKPHGKIIII